MENIKVANLGQKDESSQYFSALATNVAVMLA